MSTVAAPTICPMPGCKEKLSKIVVVVCKHCNQQYCSSHRLPEAHAEKCMSKAQSQAKSTFKRTSRRVLDAEKRRPGSSSEAGFSAGKMNADAHAQLQKKIKQKELDRKKNNAPKKK